MTNEVLCYVQNHYHKYARANLITSVVGYYNGDEVFAAKKLLHAYVDSLADKPSSLPRYTVRKSSDNKKKYDCEDMMSLVVRTR